MSNFNVKPYDNWQRRYAERKAVVVRFTEAVKPKSTDDMTMFYRVMREVYKITLPNYDDFQFVGTGTDIRLLFTSTQDAESFKDLLRGQNWYKIGIISMKWIDLPASRRRLDNTNVNVYTTQVSGEDCTKSDKVANINSGGLLQSSGQSMNFQAMLNDHLYPDLNKTPPRGPITPIKPLPMPATHSLPSLFGASSSPVVRPTSHPPLFGSSSQASVTGADAASSLFGGKQNGLAIVKAPSGSTAIPSLGASDTVAVPVDPTHLKNLADVRARIDTLNREIFAAALSKKTAEDVKTVINERKFLLSLVSMVELMGEATPFDEIVDLAKQYYAE